MEIKLLDFCKSITDFDNLKKSEKIGIIIGMLIYGAIDQITGSMRNSILFLFVFFLIGIVLLFKVPKENLQQ